VRTKEVNNGHEVDLEQLRIDLKRLAEEYAEGRVVIHDMSATHEVVADDVEKVKLEITLTADGESRFSGGYNVPF
jgi:hypothetical protein